MSGAQSRLLSVIVPAHDEERLISQCLRSLLDGAPEGELDVVVVCNGCTDHTADRARSVAAELGSIRVLEIPQSSKVAALNAGDRLAHSGYRAFIDADVELSPGALAAVRRALEEPGVLAAAPRLVVDVAGASWAVRSHYRVWEQSDYSQRAPVGSGFYALGPQGRARFGDFPDLIADDLFVKNLFVESERRTVSDHTFSVGAPATLRALVRRSARAAAGNHQWRLWVSARAGEDQPSSPRSGPTSAPPQTLGSHRASLLRRVSRRPALWPALAPYLVVYVGARLLGRWKVLRGRMHVWERDETHRADGPTTRAASSPE